MTKPPFTYEEAMAQMATAPRITKESIEAKIIGVDYIPYESTTICVIVLRNGFKVIGHSTPASHANYRADVGQSFAYENAFRQIWQLEGYLLRERLHEKKD